MNGYVASSFARKPDVCRMIRLLIEAGHTITHDWTPEDASHLLDDPAALAEYLARGAADDMLGVLTARFLIILHDDRGRGMATEFGLALAANIPIIVVGARTATGEMRNVFYYLPSVIHVDEPEQVVAVLRALPARRNLCSA